MSRRPDDPFDHLETDAVLVRRASRGDRSALSGLCARWWPKLRRWALLEAGDPRQAEDGAQEAMLRLTRFIGRADPDRPFGPWLRAVVRNACRDTVARQSRVASRELGEVDAAAFAIPMHRRLDLDRSARQALEAFATLPQRQRELVDLVDHLGWTPSEAAESLGISASAARSQLTEARRALRTRLLSDQPELTQVLEEDP